MKSALSRVGGLALLWTLASCGDDGTLGTPSGAPVPVITSPADGSTITGSRTITVTGTISGGSTIAGVQVRIGGVAVSGVTATFDNTSFSVPGVTLLDNDQSIDVVVADDGARIGTSAAVGVTYPYIRIKAPDQTDVPQASVKAYGPAFTDGTNPSYTMGAVLGSVAAYGDFLFIPDVDNNRVLAFSLSTSFTNQTGPLASFVLGQSDYGAGSDHCGDGADHGATDTCNPGSLLVAGNRLLVLDTFNSILVYDPVPTSGLPSSPDPGAPTVIGPEDNFGPNGPVCDATNYPTDFQAPSGLFVFGSKLLVADSAHNRVMVYDGYDGFFGSSPAPTLLVLGQAQDDTACAPNASAGQPMSFPSDVWTDGTRLLVSDSNNGRVLLWNNFPDADTAADVVIGSGQLGYPMSIASNGNQIFVADPDNNRVLVWNDFPEQDAPTADAVLGQVDFAHGGCNEVNQTGDADSRTLCAPTGVSIINGKLYVSDADNHRVLAFESQSQ